MMEERIRQHEAAHVRTIEAQILDALLRIEELLLRGRDDWSVPNGPPIDELITNVTPVSTPFMEAIGKPKATKKKTTRK